MQRDASGWVGLVEVRIPAKLLELGVGIADVSRDGSLSEKEFAALARDYARRAVAALSIEVAGAPVVMKVEKVSWKAQGARTLDVVASLSIATCGSTKRLGGNADLEASTRWRTCDSSSPNARTLADKVLFPGPCRPRP